MGIIFEINREVEQMRTRVIKEESVRRWNERVRWIY